MAGQRKSGGFDIVNSGDFLRSLERALEKVELDTSADLERLGLEVQNSARGFCPVDTGRLRSSIKKGPLRKDTTGYYVEVGTNVVYAPHVEFGTRFQQAQPYMRPALLEAAQKGIRP